MKSHTLRAYAIKWRAWRKWCVGAAIDPMAPDPQEMAHFLRTLGTTHAYSTVAQMHAAITDRHKRASVEVCPGYTRAVREVMRALYDAAPPPRRKLHLQPDHHARMLEICADGTLIGLRDAAIISLMWTGYFRSSEIVRLTMSDLSDYTKGRLSLRFAGHLIVVSNHPPGWPVRHLTNWLRAGNIVDGRIFRIIRKGSQVQKGALSEHAPGIILKRRLRQIGIDARHYAGLSVRKGRITNSYRNGRSFEGLVAVTRLRSADSVQYNVEPRNQRGAP